MKRNMELKEMISSEVRKKKEKEEVQNSLEFRAISMRVLNIMTENQKFIENKTPDEIIITIQKLIQKSQKKIEIILKDLTGEMAELPVLWWFLPLYLNSKDLFEIIDEKCLPHNAHFKEEVIEFLLKEKVITNGEELKEILNGNNSYVLSVQYIEKIKFLVESNMINTTEDFMEIVKNDNVVKTFINIDIEVIKFLVEKRFIKNINDLTSIFGADNALPVLTKKNIETIKFLVEKGVIKTTEDFIGIDWINFKRLIYINIGKYENLNPLLIRYILYEDRDGDLDDINNQVESAIAEIEKNDGNFRNKSLKKQFNILIDYFATNEKGNNVLDEYAIVSEKERLKNIKEVNKEQEVFLNDEFSEEKKRTLYLYIRQGHGEMDGFRATMMAKMAKKYIYQNKSLLFTDVKIVPDKWKPYPKSVHDVGFNECDILKVSGEGFRDLAKGGNIVFFTHGSCREFSKQGSLPLVSPATYIDPYKIKKHKYVKMRNYFDSNNRNSLYVTEEILKRCKEQFENTRNLKEMLHSFVEDLRNFEEEIIEGKIIKGK